MSDTSDDDDDYEQDIAAPPKSIRINNSITDVCMHPTQNNLAISDMNGYAYQYLSGEISEQKSKFRVSKKTCRCIAFSKDGKDVVTLSKLGSMKVIDVETSKVKDLIKGAHSAPPFIVKTISQYVLASGDDEGTLKVWDVRKGHEPVMDEDRCHDYISDIATDNNRKLIFVTSGEGTMTTYNIRKKKFVLQSENIENDMTSVAVIKGNNKVVVGTSEGQLLIYNWDEFAAPSDRFPANTVSLESITPLSDNIVCVGAMDGTIKAMHILPNRYLGVVGEHKGMPVDKVKASFDNQFIASSSHGNIVKFWSVGHLCHKTFDGTKKMKRVLKHTKLKETGVGDDKTDFYNDLENDLITPEPQSSSEDENCSEEEKSDSNILLNCNKTR